MSKETQIYADTKASISRANSNAEVNEIFINGLSMLDKEYLDSLREPFLEAGEDEEYADIVIALKQIDRTPHRTQLRSTWYVW